MKKYKLLSTYLVNYPGVEISLDFQRIEKILGLNLPPSSHKHRAWWANNKSHPQADSWMDVGWQVSKVDLETKTVSWKRPIYVPINQKSANGERDSLQAAINSEGMFFQLASGEVTGSSHIFSWQNVFQMLLAANPEMFRESRIPRDPDHMVFLDIMESALNNLGYSVVERKH